jgi:hypothetical protein
MFEIDLNSFIFKSKNGAGFYIIKRIFYDKDFKLYRLRTCVLYPDSGFSADLNDFEVFNITPVHFEHGLFEDPNLKTGFEFFIAENEEEFNNYCKQENGEK